MYEFDPNKKVFISYRRDSSKFIARAVFMDLRAHGYDVFMDVQSIDNGPFDTIILDQINARAHFVLILTQGSLDRCQQPDDWLRREIETALDNKRNIVPLTVEGFSFAQAKPLLTGKLNDLIRFNSLAVYHEYFDEAMERMRFRYLQNGSAVQLIPVSSAQANVTQQKMDEVLPQPTKEDLQAAGKYIGTTSTEQINKRVQQVIDDLTPATKPGIRERLSVRHVLLLLGAALLLIGIILFALVQSDTRIFGLILGIGGLVGIVAAFIVDNTPLLAYFAYERGRQRQEKKDYEGAILEYTDAILHFPDYAYAYNARGGARYHKGDYYGAVADYNKAIRLDLNTSNSPNLHILYNNRGEVYFALEQYDLAQTDFEETLRLKPDGFFGTAGLAITYYAQGNIEQAVTLWRSLIDKSPNFLNSEWVGKKLRWAEPLVEASKKLIETISSIPQ